MAATAARPRTPSPLDRRFRFAERRTTLRTEALGGLGTFLTMSYILFVNPAILSAAGVPFAAVAVATALAAAICTIANRLPMPSTAVEASSAAFQCSRFSFTWKAAIPRFPSTTFTQPQ